MLVNQARKSSVILGERVKSLAAVAALMLVQNWLAPPALGEDWQQQHMPWGDPDLQGIWTSATLTNLARPDDVDTLVLTEEQALAWEKYGQERIEEYENIGEGDLPVGGDTFAGYNSFWMDPGTHILRVRGEPRSSIIVEPEDGQLPLRLWGRLRMYWRGYQALNGTDNPEQRNQGERCTVGFGSTGGPPMLPVLYNNNYQFVQSPGHVMILVEMNHDARTIRLQGEPLPAMIKPWLGDPMGHWEDDTLVIRTTQFHPQHDLRASTRHLFYMSENSVVDERFTRISENEILYQFTVTDDDIYSQPWSGELTLRRSEGPIYEYACHEGNYALPNILAGARREEQE
ncbi:MAG: hypothetical protein O7F73_19815 [Gammaproteobacteria bacterium]|nr:hypothetical protein [Gammaproteobacteria bacterium]